MIISFITTRVCANSFSSAVAVIYTFHMFLFSVVHVEENGDPAVVSLLSRLLLERDDNKGNVSKPRDNYIKSVKIEIDFVKENIPGDIRTLPWIRDLFVDRQNEEGKKRKKRALSGGREGVALMIPAEYIVVVVSKNSMNISTFCK